MTVPLLPAATPQEWLATHLDRSMRSHEEPGYDEATRTWLTVADVLADDHAHLRRERARLGEEDGAPAVAAAKWLTGWYAGGIAHAIGYTYAFASAALLVDVDRIRFGLHADGWAQLVDLGDVEAGDLEVVVAEGHPWEGQPGVRTVADADALAASAVGSLVGASRPLLTAVRRLGKVGFTALWAEVADGLALGCLYDLSRLEGLLRTPGAPWRAVPELELRTTASGPAYVGRKGGCCLAYQCTHPAQDDEHLDERGRARLERFPAESPETSYCDTCSLRDLDDCVERQLFWRDEEQAERTAATRAG
jgi:hypothetical protein